MNLQKRLLDATRCDSFNSHQESVWNLHVRIHFCIRLTRKLTSPNDWTNVVHGKPMLSAWSYENLPSKSQIRGSRPLSSKSSSSSSSSISILPPEMRLQKSTLRPGDGCTFPTAGDKVTVEYVGWLYNDQCSNNRGAQ